MSGTFVSNCVPSSSAERKSASVVRGTETIATSRARLSETRLFTCSLCICVCLEIPYYYTLFTYLSQSHRFPHFLHGFIGFCLCFFGSLLQDIEDLGRLLCELITLRAHRFKYIHIRLK